MKKLLLIAFMLLTGANLFPQSNWTAVTSGTTQDIWGVDWASPTVVWISAAAGDIKRSTDAGATWTSAGNAGDGAYSIAAVDAQIAVACLGPASGDGKIMRTTNGGTTWTQVYTAAGAWFNHVDNVGTYMWAVSDPIGGNFHIVKSTDNGATWALASNLPAAPATNVFGANSGFYRVGNTCYFGTGGATGATLANRIYKSSNLADGPWTFGTTTAQFAGSMAFSTPSGRGVVGFWQATNTVNLSTDGGATFTAQTANVGLTRGLDYLPGTSFVWAATSLGIYQSSDNGLTWTANSIPGTVTAGVNWLRFNGNSNLGVAGGPGGVLVKSNLPPIPVELTSFVAVQDGNNVVLNWVTATEVNNQGFEIERKLDQGSWTRVGFKAGNGTTTERKEYRFSDDIAGVNAQVISYRLKQIDFGGQFEYSKAVNVENILPVEFSINQNYPNPFNPSTSIAYTLPAEKFVSLKVYDALGNEVATLLNGVQKAGSHNVVFNAAGLTSGAYYAIFKAGNNEFNKTMKMLLMK